MSPIVGRNDFRFYSLLRPIRVFVFFDTETTGIPRRWNAPLSDQANWPRVVQLAWVCCAPDGNVTATYETIIRPNGFYIPHDAAGIHGITTERAHQEGRELLDVLREFARIVDEAITLVAHNISFDAAVLGAEFLRANLSNPIASRNQICTMLVATDYCQLPGSRGYKWPKLQELHHKLFGAAHEDGHQALADVQACCRCFFELRRLGIIG
jgi:DNA polymerase III epsilon subunit-like protein